MFRNYLAVLQFKAGALVFGEKQSAKIFLYTGKLPLYKEFTRQGLCAHFKWISLIQLNETTRRPVQAGDILT